MKPRVAHRAPRHAARVSERIAASARLGLASAGAPPLAKVPRRVRVGRAAREAVSDRRETLLRRGARPPRRSSWAKLRAQVFARAEPEPTGTTTPSSPRIASHCWSEVYRFITVQ